MSEKKATVTLEQITTLRDWDGYGDDGSDTLHLVEAVYGKLEEMEHSKWHRDALVGVLKSLADAYTTEETS